MSEAMEAFLELAKVDEYFGNKKRPINSPRSLQRALNRQFKAFKSGARDAEQV